VHAASEIIVARKTSDFFGLSLEEKSINPRSMHLPPLNAVRAFDAAARHLSFRRAADELCVTAGAISRQVANLEAFLGIRLFVRRHRQVTLTRAGKIYLADVREGLSRISQATAALDTRLETNVLRLKLPPTFAMRWLMPRLVRFHAHHPEISVQITTSHAPADFENDDIDAAVQYSQVLKKGLLGERLFNEVLIPVHNSETAGADGQCSPRELASRMLLHSFRRPDDWPRWFAAAGVPGLKIKQSLVFENSSMTYQGAMDGLGVAMAHVAFVGDELRSGRLVCPVGVRLEASVAYFLVYPQERARSTGLRAFHRWLAHEAQLTRRELRKDLVWYGAAAARSPDTAERRTSRKRRGQLDNAVA
jgi:LysR family transcriptional regulator, glycine cleavage system transcriptional activator